VSAEIVHLDGAVESAVGLGVADLIADVVSTGSTLRQAGLAVVDEPILESSAILIARKEKREFDLVVRRLQGVVIARQYVLVDYDVARSNLERACEITPGIESPTISPLQKADWVAVRAMVPRREVHHVMDRLYEVGARGILVSDIHACRL
jgi:ATP phosphoribosyltransferase